MRVARYFRHDCNIPMSVPWRRSWKCPVCARRWVKEKPGSWGCHVERADEVLAVTVRGVDGVVRFFGYEPTAPAPPASQEQDR